MNPIYNYIFPFGRISKDSRIVLYGAGRVGQEYYSQMRSTGYGVIVRWIDQKFCKAPIDNFCTGIDGIQNINFDYIIIAIKDEIVRNQVAKTLCEMFPDDKSKIIFSEPENASCIKLPAVNEVFIQNSKEYLSILEKFYFNPQQFGEGQFYQSFEEIGLSGQRSTKERIEKYHLNQFTESHFDVLDIGCNCGFFDLQIASHVHSVTGVDSNESLIRVAQMTSQMLNIDNCSFICEDFKKIKNDKRYNMIFAFSVMFWLDIPISDFVKKINQLLEQNGILILESHNVENLKRIHDYKECLSDFNKEGYRMIHQGRICDDGRITREFCVLKRENEF